MFLQDLKIFKLTYELGSMNQTAKNLGFAQSNITARLQSLENDFDIQLFERTHSGVKPTEAGTAFYNYAVTVLKMTDELQHQPSFRKKQDRVLITELLFNFLVIEKKQYPLDQYDFSLIKTSELLKNLQTNPKIVITYKTLNEPHYQLRETGILPAKFYRTPQTFDLTHKPLLINSDSLCPFRKASLTLAPKHTALEIDSFANILELVAKGQGWALLPTHMVLNSPVKAIETFPKQNISYNIYQHI
ncbi:LysR family transcriptional regulator [Agrilactobacillus yilanensis]|uniref:LysR family transcriptional regulator n=1 Tax=Agrilactobacillus yilanensis TaxID=2485997 RepID=A0ABW4J3C2_9LACO|nr:LysR family transcriptional regulator [Agrilactobacillus yilanensis]